MKRARVLIVDDSAAMRRLIAVTLNADSDIEVVGEADGAAEARRLLDSLDPDVVTLDIEMPKVSGLEFLEELMRDRPVPVVVLANDTTDPRIRTRALALGAAAFISKPRFEHGHGAEFRGLTLAVKAAGRQRVRSRGATPNGKAPQGDERQKREPASAPAGSGAVVAIGASAGGVEALTAIVSRLPSDCPPMLVVQHIPPSFVAPLAQRLDKAGPARVEVATEGAPLTPGMIYLAPGDRHLAIAGGPGMWCCKLERGAPVNGFRPAIDVMFRSLARARGLQAVGVILTGMGRDGVAGLLEMRQANAKTLGQDAATSAIYGMPKAAFDAGAVERQGSPERIAAEIAGYAGSKGSVYL